MASITPDGSGKPLFVLSQTRQPIIRGDFASRLSIRIAFMHIPVTKTVMVSLARGSMIGTQALNPLPQTDEWALLPDGTVAIVRGSDYHIDWVGADGN